MRRLRNMIVSGLVLLVGRRRRNPKPEETRLVPALPTNPVAELVVLGLLGLSSLSALGFILIYAFGSELPEVTPLLGATMGLAFLFLAAALVVVGLKLVPTEEIAEEYPPHEHPGEQQVIAELIDESGTRFTRRRLFKLGLLGAGGTLGLALLTPGRVLRAALPRRRLPPHAVAARAAARGRERPPLQGVRHREERLLPRVPRGDERRGDGSRWRHRSS